MTDKLKAEKTADFNAFVRNIADGSAANSEHAQMVTNQFIAAAGAKSGLGIKDEAKLRRVAAELGIKIEGRLKNEIAVELGELLLKEFSKQEEELIFLKRAPPKRQEVWRKLGIAPSGIKQEINAIVKAANIGGAHQHLLSAGARCALTNGWGSNMIAAELEDIMFGTPAPKLSTIIQCGANNCDEKVELITGFSPEAIIYCLGGTFRGSLRPLLENIVNGRIRGIAGIFDCNNAQNVGETAHLAVVKELIKNDVLVLFTGSSPFCLAKAGLMVPEGAQYAGEGLRSVCEAVGLPPVLHMGGYVDNCRILYAASAIAAEAKLGDISDLPACIAAPEGMNEKAIATGQCFVSSGFYMIAGITEQGIDMKEVPVALADHAEDFGGGKWDFEANQIKMAQKMIAYIDEKRKALGIDKARERVLYDMAMRRELI